MSTEYRPSVANVAVALAAGLALFSYAGALANPAAAAETHYLAIWITCMLLTLAALAVAPALDLAAIAVLATAITWVVPHGPTRGAAVGLLLMLGFAFIEIRHVEKTTGRLTWTWAIPSALALQFLCQSDRFLGLGSDPRVLIGVFALPLLVAGTFILLQLREGFLPSLLAIMTCALLVPGWSVTVVLSLLAVATGILWRDRVVRRWVVMVAAGLIIIAADTWQPSLAWLLLLTMLAKAIPASWKTGVAAVITTTLLVLFLPEVRGWDEVIRLMALGPILLPALLLPSDTRRSASIQAFVLAVLALRTVDGPAALAAPLVLAALSLRASAVAARFQLVWTGTLLGGVTLLGAYPWLRSPALDDVLALFSLQVDWIYAVGIVFVVWLLTFACAAFVDRTERLRCRPVLIVGLVLSILAWMALPSPAVKPFGTRIQTLDREATEIAIDLESTAPTRSVVVDTYLENAALLPTGSPVARINLIGDDGEQRGWLLRAGVETGEWAARRPDVAGLQGFEAPPHWLAWVTPSGELMAQRYRAVWELDRAVDVTRLELERFAGLPPDVNLAVFHLELRR